MEAPCVIVKLLNRPTTAPPMPGDEKTGRVRDSWDESLCSGLVVEATQKVSARAEKRVQHGKDARRDTAVE
jgi:hypothetical protein